MSFVTRFLGTNLDFLMDSLFFSHCTQLVGVRVCLGVAEAGPFSGLGTSQLRPRVASSESLADLICFKV